MAEQVDLLSAECWAAGAVGIEEREDGAGCMLLVYAQAARAQEVEQAARESLGARESSGEEGRVEPPEPVESGDWSERWKEGLAAVVVSPRLVVRPSFVEITPEPGRLELVIDPKQAFGTGGHASTLLALEWVDVLADELPASSRVLDIGTGTGVLALAALRLGAGEAVAFDIDPIAVCEAREWAELNELAERLRLFAGPLDALAAADFDLVVANLLRRELLPLAADVAGRLTARGSLVLSGLLAEEQGEIEAAFGGVGLRCAGARFAEDGGEQWVSLCMRRS
ncbi:MAG: 50S ribosomal protein L11 methyltransferase [Deltaproteobacteria bacterium]|nr:50S ribosomal protein L11 methyltransferase [Deltaproteobacteria bacterium]MBW2417729.1 50S ribosomal protein L11 methyltransferase [Deltaproteobacteria bacterium]